MPTIGAFSVVSPSEPKNGASPEGEHAAVGADEPVAGSGRVARDADDARAQREPRFGAEVRRPSDRDDRVGCGVGARERRAARRGWRRRAARRRGAMSATCRRRVCAVRAGVAPHGRARPAPGRRLGATGGASSNSASRASCASSRTRGSVAWAARLSSAATRARSRVSWLDIEGFLSAEVARSPAPIGSRCVRRHALTGKNRSGPYGRGCDATGTGAPSIRR